MKPRIFLSAEWRQLVMANYEVDPELLRPYLPAYTELDVHNGKCLVSLVGFLFAETRVRGIKYPFHVNFPEVNLRMYVRHKAADGWRRGVVFINEIVPRRAICWVANSLFGEHYIYAPMRFSHYNADGIIKAAYSWKKRGRWHHIEATATDAPMLIPENTPEEFIFEHYYGYSDIRPGVTGEYTVEHPRWRVYPVTACTIDCAFESLYGPAFAPLGAAKPDSVFLAEGSAVNVYQKRIIEG